MDRTKVCFLCGLNIDGKSHDEHIFPDSFLNQHSLKNEKVTLSDGESITYSRIKVDAHQRCNNEFGSRYESRILNLLSSVTTHSDVLEKMHLSAEIMHIPSSEPVKLLTTWFCKIFYGMNWFDSHRKNHKYPEYQNLLRSNQLSDANLKLLQKAYQLGKGFNLPSSIYYLKLDSPVQLPFDQGFMQHPPIIWMKTQEHFFMIAIADGQLAYNYIDEDLIGQMKEQFIRGGKHPLFFLIPLSHLIAVARNLPKSPSFVIGQDSIINMSLTTLSTKQFNIDSDQVNRDANRIYHEELRPRYPC